jgi:predicted transposase YdaD
MAPDRKFLARLYAESGRFVQQEDWEREWQVVVICPNRKLNFGSSLPVREFLEHRVRWIELLPSDGQDVTEPLTQVLGLLLQPEAEVRAITDRLRQQASNNPAAQQVLPLIAAILLARFNDRPISEICAMGGLSLDDFTKSRAYREIYREGEAAGEARGEASVTLRLLNRRCGTLSAATTARIQALPLGQLESLADALLDFTGPEDLQAWLRKQA